MPIYMKAEVILRQNLYIELNSVYAENNLPSVVQNRLLAAGLDATVINVTETNNPPAASRTSTPLKLESPAGKWKNSVITNFQRSNVKEVNSNGASDTGENGVMSVLNGVASGFDEDSSRGLFQPESGEVELTSGTRSYNLRSAGNPPKQPVDEIEAMVADTMQMENYAPQSKLTKRTKKKAEVRRQKQARSKSPPSISSFYAAHLCRHAV